VDKVVTAIGADVAENWPAGEHQIQLSHCRMIDARRPIILAGDMTTPAKSVSNAIASGKQAAMALDILCELGADKISSEMKASRVGSGPAVSMNAYLEKHYFSRTAKAAGSLPKTPALVEFNQINLDYFAPSRRSPDTYLNLEERITSFSECETGLTEDAARAEAQRCFNCGTCSACDNCRLFCPEAAVLVSKPVRSIDLDYCKGCGVCVTECPRNAMAMEE
jgi:Pyruvate/2-oxoacid:ferredoxin oxidoreductase delta subunit